MTTWQQYRACTACGVKQQRACRNDDDTVAQSPCGGRKPMPRRRSPDEPAAATDWLTSAIAAAVEGRMRPLREEVRHLRAENERLVRLARTYQEQAGMAPGNTTQKES